MGTLTMVSLSLQYFKEFREQLITYSSIHLKKTGRRREHVQKLPRPCTTWVS